ncbi:MAG: hypothetical protein EXQ87_07775 [Alphaproteobacteria bacterium]|nr:hypothetical protein [Alphaproteobacteria bacterium]
MAAAGRAQLMTTGRRDKQRRSDESEFHGHRRHPTTARHRRYGLACAGVPERLGYGVGRQTLWLNKGPMLGTTHRNTFALDKCRLLLEGLTIPVPEREPRLIVAPATRARLLAKFADRPRPWVGFGVGASKTWKLWPVRSFDRLLDGLDKRLPGTRFVLGAPTEADRVAAVANRPNTVPASNLPLDEVMALVAECTFLVGNDSGPLNLAVAMGTVAFGLFGTTPPLVYTTRLKAIVPPGDQFSRTDGMARITPDDVLELLGPVLNPTFLGLYALTTE